MTTPFLLVPLIEQHLATFTAEEILLLDPHPSLWDGEHCKFVLGPEVKTFAVNWVELEEIKAGKFPDMDLSLRIAIAKADEMRKHEHEDAVIYYPCSYNSDLPKYDPMNEGDHYWLLTLQDSMKSYKPKEERTSNSPANSGHDHCWEKEKLIRLDMDAELDKYETMPVEINHPNEAIVKLIQRTYKSKANNIYYGSILRVNICGDWDTLYKILQDMGGWANNHENGSYLVDSFVYEKEGEPTVICNYCEGDLDFEIK